MKAIALLILVLCTFAPAFAQDTRGSLVPDAQVTLADGTQVAVQDVKAGAKLWVWLPGGKAGAAAVTAVRRQHADSFVRLYAGSRELKATGSHRVALAGGKLVRLDTIKTGDKIWISGPAGPLEAAVTQVRVYPATLVAYDLTVEGHQLFVADGVVVGD